LFPGTAAVEEKVRGVVANFVPKFDAWRITFTFVLINQARQVCFLANANKNPALIEKVLAGDQQYPAARVEPADGNLTWILGEA
jgi:6-phosphogluconolactonase